VDGSNTSKWRLGAPEAFPDEAVDHIAASADVEGTWNQDAFASGMRDMLTAESGTLDAIAAFLHSDRCRVPLSEHEGLWSALGGAATLALWRATSDTLRHVAAG
jgi:hypothetical protein